MSRTDRVTIRDVGPRDGLQSLDRPLGLQHRVELVERLMMAGLQRVECGSFVSERAVPQMAGTAELLDALGGRPDLEREVLVVNRAGAERALDAAADRLVVVVAASETFSMRNVRMTTTQAIEQLTAIMELAEARRTPVTVDIATAFGCAYEGIVPCDRVVEVGTMVADLGASELVLADTAGVGTPRQVRELAAALADIGPTLGLHLHDTRGLGLVNLVAALEVGVRLFDTGIGGIGGCPYSPGATGNVATDEVVHLLDLMGVETGIDLGLLIDTAGWLEEVIDEGLPSRVLRSGPTTSWASMMTKGTP